MKKILLLLLLITPFIIKAQVIKANELQLKSTITFDGGTANLSKDNESGLQEIKAYLEAKQYISLLRIEGHTAGFPHNQELSEQRALAVCQWLVTHGIDCKRLIAIGFGSNKPAGEGKNTRIVVANAALRGHPIGGLPVDGGGNNAGDVCK